MGLEIVLSIAWATIIDMLPKIAGTIIVLIIGWIVGRIIGKGISQVLDRVGVDDALRKTVIGKALERSGVTVVRFFDLIIRWFIYLIAVFAAADILGAMELIGADTAKIRLGDFEESKGATSNTSEVGKPNRCIPVSILTQTDTGLGNGVCNKPSSCFAL